MLRGLILPITASLIVHCGAFSYCQEKPRRQFTITPFRASHSTTRLTQVDANGLPDYSAWFEARDSQGITDDNNAAAFLVPLMRDAMEPSIRQQLSKRFSLEPTSGTPQLGPINDSCERLLGTPLKNLTIKNDEDYVAGATVWLKRNTAAIKIIEQSIDNCDRFFCTAFRGDGSDRSMSNYHCPALQWVRQWAKALAVKAMLQLENGEIKAAVRSAKRLFKLARLAEQPSDHYMTFATRFVRRTGYLVYLAIGQNHGTNNVTLAAVQQLIEIDQQRPHDDYIDDWLRLCFLDGMCRTCFYGSDYFFDYVEKQRRDGVAFPLLFALADWNLCLKDANGFFDRWVEARRTEDVARNKELFSEVDSSVRQSGSLFLFYTWLLRDSFQYQKYIPARMPVKLKAFQVVANVVSVRLLATEINTNLFLYLTLENTPLRVQRNESYGFALKEVTATAIACHRYRKQHGKYPKTLKALVPDFLSMVPIDPKHKKNKPLKIQHTSNELLICSIGDDQVYSTIGGLIDVNKEFFVARLKK